MPLFSQKLNYELHELRTAIEENELATHSLRNSSRFTFLQHRMNPIQMLVTALKKQLEHLSTQPHSDAEKEVKLKEIILKCAPMLSKLLVGDDKKSFVFGAYLGNDAKLYSLETVYAHIICSVTHDNAPLTPEVKPWSITQHHGLMRLVRFSNRHDIAIGNKENSFWDNLGIQPTDNDISNLLPLALNQSLVTKLKTLGEASQQSDDLSKKLLQWIAIFLSTLSKLRDTNNQLISQNQSLAFIKDFWQRQYPELDLPNELDEWIILDYFLEQLLKDILIDPITLLSLDEKAVILNDDKKRTYNLSTFNILLPQYPSLHSITHPALGAFFAWIKEYDPHIKVIRLHRRHLSAIARTQNTEAYKLAQQQNLLHALQIPLQSTLESVREKMKKQLDEIENKINNTQAKIIEIAANYQQTDREIQTLQAAMDECSLLWQELLQDLIPKQDPQLEQGQIDLKNIQERAETIKRKSELIHQRLINDIESYKKENLRLKKELAGLSADVNAVERHQLETAQNIIAYRQEIAERKEGFFAQIAVAAGFIMGAVVGCGVGAIVGGSAAAIKTAAMTSCALTTTFFTAMGGGNAKDFGTNHHGRLGSSNA